MISVTNTHDDAAHGSTGSPAPSVATQAAVSDGATLYPLSGTADGVFALLRDIAVCVRAALNAIVRPMWVDPTTNDAKVKLTSGTVTTVTTVTTATKLSQLGSAGIDASTTVFSLDRLNWAQTVRGRIQ